MFGRNIGTAEQIRYDTGIKQSASSDQFFVRSAGLQDYFGAPGVTVSQCHSGFVPARVFVPVELLR